MEQSPSSETNSDSANQEITRLLWNPNVLTVFTRAHHWSLRPVSRPCVTFHNKLLLFFYGEELLAPSQTPSSRTTPYRLSATAYSIQSQELCISGGRLEISYTT